MLASAWKLASEALSKFATSGITDHNIKNKLKGDVGFRNEYMVLWDMVNTLVDLSQNRFSVLATATRTQPFISSYRFLIYETPSSLCKVFQTKTYGRN